MALVCQMLIRIRCMMGSGHLDWTLELTAQIVLPVKHMKLFLSANHLLTIFPAWKLAKFQMNANFLAFFYLGNLLVLYYYLAHVDYPFIAFNSQN